jgi:hypothetical protein
MTNAAKRVDSRRFDRFMRSTPVWDSALQKSQFTKAKLRRNHPTDPSGEPLLRIFASHAEGTMNPFISTILAAQHLRYERLLAWNIIGAAKLLHKTGNTTGSRWLLSYGHDKRPDIFSPEAFRKLGQNPSTVEREESAQQQADDNAKFRAAANVEDKSSPAIWNRMDRSRKTLHGSDFDRKLSK